MNWKEIYRQAHEKHFREQYPSAYVDGHYCGPKFPNVQKPAGLSKAIKNLAHWEGRPSPKSDFQTIHQYIKSYYPSLLNRFNNRKKTDYGTI